VTTPLFTNAPQPVTPIGGPPAQSPAASWLAEVALADLELRQHFSSAALNRRLDLMGRRPRYTGPSHRGTAYVDERGDLVIHGARDPEHLPLLVAWITKVFGMEDPR
jgi:hypothetical protein